jgi:pimeloyl-ACP methyl ester carboxylesterase
MSRSVLSRILAIAALVVSAFISLQAATTLKDQFFDSNGVRIRYVDMGKGEPLVLVHGILGDVESNWQQTGVLDRLTPHFRIIALDMRGHGKSGKPHETDAYGAAMGADVARLLDHLGIRQAHILGYSLGAYVVGSLLAAHPDRFKTVTFGGSTPMLKWNADSDRRAEISAKEYENGSLRSLLIGIAPAGQPPTEAEIKSRSEEALAAQDRYAIAAVRRSYKGLVVSEQQVTSVRVPMLAVVGSDDPKKADVDALKIIRPDLRVVVIQGATHNAPRNALERPEFAQAVRDFVEAHSSLPKTR